MNVAVTCRGVRSPPSAERRAVIRAVAGDRDKTPVKNPVQFYGLHRTWDCATSTLPRRSGHSRSLMIGSEMRSQTAAAF